MNKVVLAVLAVALLLVVGCGPESSKPAQAPAAKAVFAATPTPLPTATPNPAMRPIKDSDVKIDQELAGNLVVDLKPDAPIGEFRVRLNLERDSFLVTFDRVSGEIKFEDPGRFCKEAYALESCKQLNSETRQGAQFIKVIGLQYEFREGR